MIGNAIVHYLNTSEELKKLVGTNIFPVIVPENKKLPYIMYQQIDTEPQNSKDGPSDVEFVRFYVNSYSGDYSECSKLAFEVRKALENKGGYESDGITSNSITVMDERDLSALSDNKILLKQLEVRIEIHR